METDEVFDDKVIDVQPPRKRRLWILVLLAIVLVLFLFGSPLLAIYVDALWFSSLGFSEAYWYKFRLGGLLFVIFFAVTFLILRLSFAALTRWLPQLRERPRITPAQRRRREGYKHPGVHLSPCRLASYRWARRCCTRSA